MLMSGTRNVIKTQYGSLRSGKCFREPSEARNEQM